LTADTGVRSELLIGIVHMLRNHQCALKVRSINHPAGGSRDDDQ